ncbi:MAG: dodecin domain-containing protein [Caldilineaceae bacterium]|nr:dodecin domain-containing protein [Caldilineaceae bacterium]MCB0098689.1 dodecin domain-containing protein [Caldilineaceae bacterium]MCB0138559.1 dodecin domain-containing protein [Caldilineaceae bacterium]
MNSHIYKQIELTGTSESSIEDAVQRAITKAAATVRNIHWFEVLETRGAVDENSKIQWQVIVKVAFSLDD